MVFDSAVLLSYDGWARNIPSGRLTCRTSVLSESFELTVNALLPEDFRVNLCQKCDLEMRNGDGFDYLRQTIIGRTSTVITREAFLLCRRDEHSVFRQTTGSIVKKQEIPMRLWTYRSSHYKITTVYAGYSR